MSSKQSYTERNDVVQAIEKLNAAVRSINKDGRQKLTEAFNEVIKHFKPSSLDFFKVGSRAALVDSTDP